MSSKVRMIWNAMEGLVDTFGRKAAESDVDEGGTPRIEDLSRDDLARERIRLEQEEKKLLRLVEEVESEKRAAFEQATKESSVRKQTIMARKIKELDTKSKNLDRNLRVLSQQLRIINGFIQVKENQRIWEQSGLWSHISQMDLSELGAYVDDSQIEGAFNSEKFSSIIGTLEGSPGIVEMEEDDEVMDILSEIQAASAARDVDGAYARLEEQLQAKQDTEPF